MKTLCLSSSHIFKSVVTSRDIEIMINGIHHYGRWVSDHCSGHSTENSGWCILNSYTGSTFDVDRSWWRPYELEGVESRCNMSLLHSIVTQIYSLGVVAACVVVWLATVLCTLLCLLLDLFDSSWLLLPCCDQLGLFLISYQTHLLMEHIGGPWSSHTNYESLILCQSWACLWFCFGRAAISLDGGIPAVGWLFPNPTPIQSLKLGVFCQYQSLQIPFWTFVYW